MAMTAKELLAKKTDLLKRKDEHVELNIKGLGVWRFGVPCQADYVDAAIYAEAHNLRNSDPVLLYNMLEEPNLKDAEVVQMAGEVLDRSDTFAGPWMIEAFLRPGQVKQVISELMSRSGYGDGEVVEVKAVLDGGEFVKN